MNDELMELPEGWENKEIQELCDFNPKHSKELLDDFKISFVPMATVDDVNGEIGLHETRLFGEVRKGYTHFSDGDVIFAKITPCMENGKSAVARNLVNGLACGSTEFHVLRSFGGILPDYLHGYLRQQKYLNEAAANMTGVVGQRRLPKDFLLATQIPLPPLNEQKRIVAQIEILRERSQKAKAALEAIPELCDRFRQSVLAAAFRGDLTADWREENPDVEPASVLLERIRRDRYSLWCNELSAKGRNPSKSSYQEPIESNTSELPELPDNWQWATLDQLLCSLRNGLSRKPADELPGIPILRISAVRSMEVNIHDIRFYRPDISEEISSYILKSSDLLFTRYNGNQNFVGVCGLVPEVSESLLYPDKLIRGRLVNKDLCLPKFLEFICNVGVSREHIERNIKTSAGQYGIAGSDIKSTPIPLPPIAEQKIIVETIEKQFSTLRKLMSLVDICCKNFQMFNQSILAKAFRGELVDQDPNDEPAAVLLERIRAEREAQQPAKQKQRKGSKRSKTTKSDQINLPLE